MINIPPKTESKFIKKILPLFIDAKKFLDIGAADGWYTFLAAKSMPSDSIIYGFEPIEFIFDKYKNMYVDSWEEKEWYKNKTFILNQKVVTNKNVENVTFYKPKGKSGNINLSAVSHNTSYDKFDLPATCIDDLITQTDKNCFIKIDVEGHELDVLKGGEEYFTNCENSIIFLELHVEYLYNQGIEPSEVIEYLTNKNYSYELIAYEEYRQGREHNFLEWYIFKK